jgi:hypothetical protein
MAQPVTKLQTNTKRTNTLPRHKIGFYGLIVIALAIASIIAVI